MVGSSQELIASTMIHEVLHSYFDYNQIYYTNSLGQHLEMATNFVDKMRISLQKSFPNLIDKDANALIINGFSEIQSNLPANFQQILDKYNLTINDVGTIRDSYKKNGTAGNRCN